MANSFLERQTYNISYCWRFYPGTLEWYPNPCFGGLTPNFTDIEVEHSTIPWRKSLWAFASFKKKSSLLSPEGGFLVQSNFLAVFFHILLMAEIPFTTTWDVWNPNKPWEKLPTSTAAINSIYKDSGWVTDDLHWQEPPRLTKEKVVGTWKVPVFLEWKLDPGALLKNQRLESVGLEWVISMYTWNPNGAPCFWLEFRPYFGGLTFKNRCHLGSRCVQCICLCIYLHYISISLVNYLIELSDFLRRL